jgi:hypothetical protein
MLRGLASLAAASVVALAGRSSAEAIACTAPCDRLPAGTARDRCLAACTAADQERAGAEATRAEAQAAADQARAKAQAIADAARAEAQTAADEARARGAVLRAWGGDASRLCRGRAAVSCCASGMQ